MTRISGHSVVHPPCCDAELGVPRYASVNMLASECWTDGRVVGSLFDNGGGLRRCICGSYFLLNQADSVDKSYVTDLPQAIQVQDTELKALLAEQKFNSEVEIVARRRYWQYLNDPYREIYRVVREIDSGGHATYEPNQLQRANMEQLLVLLDTHHTQNWIEMTELLRELGEADAAQKALKYSNKSQVRDAELQSQLLSQGITGPVRFRY
jgi:hypothetical protein